MITPVNFNFISYKPSFRAIAPETGHDNPIIKETILFELHPDPLKNIMRNVDPELKDFTSKLINLLDQKNKTPQDIMKDKRASSDLILERAKEYYKNAIPSLEAYNKHGIKFYDNIATNKDGSNYSGVISSEDHNQVQITVYKDGKRKEIFRGLEKPSSEETGKLNWGLDKLIYNAYIAYDNNCHAFCECQINSQEGVYKMFLWPNRNAL